MVLVEEEEISALLSEPSGTHEPVDLSSDLDLSSILSESIINSKNSSKIEISPEDSAWADSCLVLNLDLPEGNWNAMKQALIDALSTYQNPNLDVEMSQEESKVEERERIENGGDGNGESSGENEEIIETRGGIFRVMDALRTHENPNLDVDMEQETDDDEDAENGEDKNGEDRNGEDEEIVETRESIFGIWDLDIQQNLNSNEEEEGELIKDLKKILMGESKNCEGKDDMDELVADLSNLSLKQFDSGSDKKFVK